MRRHTSYKLKEDSLEQLVKQSIAASVKRTVAKKALERAQKDLVDAEQEYDELVNKIAYLLKAKNRKSITVNRVRFTLLEDGSLERSLVLEIKEPQPEEPK